MKKKYIFYILLIFNLLNCHSNGVNKVNIELNNESLTDDFQQKITEKSDTIVISEIHNPNFIICDLDGDNNLDSVKLVKNIINEKYGLEIIFGDMKKEYLGMGMDVLNRGFDDLDWVGVFEIAPKGELYWNNVSEDGDIMVEEEINEEDKILLLNDGIFIHQLEACGGGIIYFTNGKFEWIQQE